MASKSGNENWRKQEQPSNNFKFQEINDHLFSCVIPASPNWYCSNVMASMNGYIAFGGKWAVYLINLQKNPPVCEGYLFGSPGYSCKVTAVMFCQLDKNKDQAILPSHCALGMEDGLVKLINCGSKVMFREHRKHQVKISGISWSPLDNDVMVTGDEKGTVSTWSIEENTINVWIPIPNMISCLEMSPNLVNVAAIGYGNGNICVCNLKKRQIMQVFKSHIDEVCTLSWCPGYFKEKNCFVSGSKDLTMRLWDVCAEKPLSSYNMPKNMLGKKKDETQKMKLTKYHSVQWLNESQVLSSHPSGKILSWDLESHSWKALDGGHHRLVFAMRKDALTDQFVSISIDRQLIIWSCKQMKPAHVFPTVGGFLYSLTSTPLDPYSIAFGSGDNIIRVWNTGDLKQSYKHTTLWQGIKTKVMIVKYHPNREGILAFGTEDGHVGCYNVISKKYDLAISYHRKSVYSLAWGPNCILEDSTQINSLYSIGSEGTILMHKLGSFDSESINISLLIKTENKLVTVPLRSEVSWRIDYLFVAIGNEDGSIDVLTTKMHCICRVLVHKKIINSLAWHHSYSLDTFGKSYLCWLASGSDDYNVCVTDVSDALKNNNNELEIVIKPICQLSNQSGRITEVAWSPHTNGVLASASFDGSVQIWNILTGEGIANYRGHIGRVYTVMWSYSDCDVLYTGGDDFTVHRWKISEQIFQTPSISKKTKTRSKRNKATVVQQPITVDVSKDIKNNEKLIEERVNATLSSSNNELPIFVPANFFPKDDKKKKRMRSLLKKSSVADSKTKEAMQTDCILLAQYLKAESEKEGSGTLVCKINPGSEEHPNLGLYASRKDAYNMLQTECKGHEENNSMEQLIQLEAWRNNISGLINNAADNSSLNDTIVALSPLGGFNIWRACMLAYAEQLEKKRNFNLAALYFLAIGETDKAVNVFKENGLFKEAVALAKVRLSKSNPLVQELYLLWAQKLTDENNNENAAECYLAAGKIDEAITILAKRGDSSSLLTAIKVADTYDMRNRSVEYLYRCIELLISEQKWDICGTLLNQISSIQVSHLRAVVSELLIDKLQTADLINATHQNHYQHRNYTKQEYFSNSTPFLENVLLVLENCFKITFDSPQIKHLNLSSLKHERIAKLSGKDPKEVVGIVTDRVLFGIMSLLEFDIQSCFKAWLFAFNALLSSGFYLTLISLFDALFPKSRCSYMEIKNNFGRGLQVLCSDEDCFRNFVAFKCIGYLYKVWWGGASETISNLDIDRSMFNSKVDDLDLSDFENSDDALKKCDFFFLICFFKNILLSDDHIHYYSVIEQIELVDRAIIERDIKHNLTAYLRTNNNADPKCVQNVDCEVRELVDSIVESVLQQFCLDGDIQIANNILPVEKYNNIEQQRTSLVAEAESFKDCVKEYAFPHPRESALALERLCRFENDTRFKNLRGEICDWISKNKITKSC